MTTTRMIYQGLLVLLLLTWSALAESPHQKALTLAEQEWIRFGKQTIGLDGKLSHRGGREDEEEHYLRVADYWKRGVDVNLTGKDTHVAWSAAFMSWLMKEAGMAERFSYSDWHATYIRNSIRARRANDRSFSFWGYRLTERAPQVGDLVGYARQGGIAFNYQPTVYKSHTDIVVAVRPNEIDVIGGNVQDSVTKKTLRTNDQGLLIDKNHRWFVVMAPNP